MRDPFDRLVSSYRFLVNGGVSAADRADADSLGIVEGGFRDFVVPRLADAAGWQIHFRPQSFYLHGVPNPHVYDFADKHRALEEISAAVGVHPAPALQDRNKSVGAEKAAGQYDEQAREIVRAVYREDFELLAALKSRVH